ncbi:MAG: polyphosphate kinase 2 family protein [Anaerolineae bacterium]|nr:polyphosphate kinase 2 family protein [Anaerolineae bacterium]
MDQPFLVPAGSRVSLADYDPDYTGSYVDKAAAKAELKRSSEKLQDLQEVMWAEGKHSLLIVLQAMDAGGKDGTIKHVMRGVNPQGCQVTSFKVPTREELDHDFLWRIHKAVPRRGYIGIFNRSHYEDVLVVRVENLAPEQVWQQRYEQINHFEKLLADTGTTILKFYLHISKEEQKDRFEARLRDPHKNWKFSMEDVEKRELWDSYMRAFEDALSRCSAPWAPWYVIPANHKWYRNLVISQIIVDTLTSLDMRYPPPLPNADQIAIP